MQEQQHPFLLHDTERQRRDERRRYESWDRMNYAWRAQKTAQNYRAIHDQASKSPNPSPPRAPIHRHNNHHTHYRSLSPASRTQAIARGQRELMEMVKNMPEACYELSLKDLVEHNHRTDHINNNHDHRAGDDDDDDEEEGEQEDEERNDVSSRKNLLERREEIGEKNMKRAGLNDVVLRGGRVGINGTGSGQGHLLKMVFPVSFGPKRKKKKKKMAAVKSLGGGDSKNDDTNSNCSTTVLISPKTSSGNSNNNSGGGGVDKEWWKKRYSVAAAAEGGESDLSGGDRLSSSSNSGGSKSSSTSGSRSSSHTSRSNSNNARHGNGVGCWWFLGVKEKQRR